MSKDKSNNDTMGRLYLVYAVMVLFCIAVVCRILYIQIFKREELVEYAEEFGTRIVETNGMRGNIISKNNTVIAVTIPVYDIYFDPVDVIDDKYYAGVGGLADSLSAMLKENSKSYYVKKFDKAKKNKNRYVPVAKRLSIDEYTRLKTFPIFSEKRNNGLVAEKRYVRERPYGDIALRAVGYVKTGTLDPVKVGLEGAYDTCLVGKKGVQLQRRINGGKFINVPSEINVPPQNGNDIYTSIDIEMQDIAEEALRRCLADNMAEKGCVIMMDVETGFVEVMASLKRNDKTNKYEESYNFAIAENVEPGSTFKAITMTALLENDPGFDINRVLNLGPTGKMRFHNLTMTDSHVIADGKPTVKQAFWESSNIAFGFLTTEAFGSNPQKFIDLIKKTKINEPLNLDLKGEGKPYIKNTSDKTWSKVSLPWMSIGYELNVTPIVLLTYYNAIANDGKMMKPQFVKEIRRGNTVVKKFEPVVINDSIASEKTIRTLQQLLRGVVENGTAKIMNNVLFPVAGKTGTAQISGGKEGYNKKNYTASFVGYFPADNPKYSCIVMVCNPSAGKYYGASVSAPVFKEISEKIYATELGITEVTSNYAANCDKYTKASQAYYDDVKAYCDMTGVRMVDSELGSDWVRVKASTNGGVVIENVENERDVVPNFIGMNVADAVYLVENNGWKADFKGCGVVAKQSVAAGKELKKGKTIEFVLK